MCEKERKEENQGKGEDCGKRIGAVEGDWVGMGDEEK